MNDITVSERVGARSRLNVRINFQLMTGDSASPFLLLLHFSRRVLWLHLS